MHGAGIAENWRCSSARTLIKKLEMKISNSWVSAISISIFSAVFPHSKASEIILPAVNSGFYNLYGQSSQSLGSGGNTGVLGAKVPAGSPLYYNWLAFDLSLINGAIVAATLEIYSDKRNTSGQGVLWRDVSTPYSQLGLAGTTTADKTLGKQIYSDLGSGQVYGQGTHTAGALNSFTLNGDALAALNATDSYWAIGGENTAVVTAPYNFAFGYGTGIPGTTMQLRLEVEEVSQLSTRSANVPEGGPTILMLGVGMIGLIALSRRAQTAGR